MKFLVMIGLVAVVACAHPVPPAADTPPETPRVALQQPIAAPEPPPEERAAVPTATPTLASQVRLNPDTTQEPFVGPISCVIVPRLPPANDSFSCQGDVKGATRGTLEVRFLDASGNQQRQIVQFTATAGRD